jgi:hypothetical protein
VKSVPRKVSTWHNRYTPQSAHTNKTQTTASSLPQPQQLLIHIQKKNNKLV